MVTNRQTKRWTVQLMKNVCLLQMIQDCEFGACLTKADPEDWEAGKMICLGGMTYWSSTPYHKWNGYLYKYIYRCSLDTVLASFCSAAKKMYTVQLEIFNYRLQLQPLFMKWIICKHKSKRLNKFLGYAIIMLRFWHPVFPGSI
jgi:hypothetical protein